MDRRQEDAEPPIEQAVRYKRNPQYKPIKLEIDTFMLDGVAQVAFRESVVDEAEFADHSEFSQYDGHGDEFRYFAQLLEMEGRGSVRPFHTMGFAYDHSETANGYELRFTLPGPGSLHVAEGLRVGQQPYQSRLYGGDFTRQLITSGLSLGNGTSVISVHEHFVHFPFMASVDPSIANRVVQRGQRTDAVGGHESYRNFERDFEFAVRAETVVAALDATRFTDREIEQQLIGFDGCDPDVFKVHDRISHLLYGESRDTQDSIQDTIAYIRHIQHYFGYQAQALAA